MTKKDGESMMSYYQQLQLQAEKCGIKCCLDIKIRDRLIQAIFDEDILAEIISLHNPSAADVFAKYTEVVKVRGWILNVKCWFFL